MDKQQRQLRWWEDDEFSELPPLEFVHEYEEIQRNPLQEIQYAYGSQNSEDKIGQTSSGFGEGYQQRTEDVSPYNFLSQIKSEPASQPSTLASEVDTTVSNPAVRSTAVTAPTTSKITTIGQTILSNVDVTTKSGLSMSYKLVELDIENSGGSSALVWIPEGTYLISTNSITTTTAKPLKKRAYNRQINSRDNTLSIHRQEKSRNYKCHFCEKSFPQNSQLRRHEKVHEGSKLFRCPFPGCGIPYNIHATMVKHFKAVHNGARKN